MSHESAVVTYGKTYNEEIARYIDRRAAPRIWWFSEFRQHWQAYVRKSDGAIVVLQDDDRLDFTRVIVYATRADFEAYKAWRISPNSIYADR